LVNIIWKGCTSIDEGLHAFLLDNNHTLMKIVPYGKVSEKSTDLFYRRLRYRVNKLSDKLISKWWSVKVIKRGNELYLEITPVKY